MTCGVDETIMMMLVVVVAATIKQWLYSSVLVLLVLLLLLLLPLIMFVIIPGLCTRSCRKDLERAIESADRALGLAPNLETAQKLIVSICRSHLSLQRL